MKKIIISIFSSLFLIFTLSNTYAYELSRNDSVNINKIVNAIEKNVNTLGIEYRDQVLSKLKIKSSKLTSETKASVITQETISKLKKIKFYNFSLNHYKENKVNIDLIKDDWLNWHNEARKNNNVKNNYTYDEILNNTAFEWSYNSKTKGIMDHKRYNNSSYYDSKQIGEWFSERGVNCSAVNGIAISESIGYNSYYCNKNSSNCNEEVKKALKQIFDLYMSEKGTKYPNDAHYRAIVHNNINKIGLGLAISKQNNDYKDYQDYDYYKVYITTHYCTELID